MGGTRIGAEGRGGGWVGRGSELGARGAGPAVPDGWHADRSDADRAWHAIATSSLRDEPMSMHFRKTPDTYPCQQALNACSAPDLGVWNPGSFEPDWLP